MFGSYKTIKLKLIISENQVALLVWDLSDSDKGQGLFAPLPISQKLCVIRKTENSQRPFEALSRGDIDIMESVAVVKGIGLVNVPKDWPIDKLGSFQLRTSFSVYLLP